jgi:hypothetical protein
MSEDDNSIAKSGASPSDADYASAVSPTRQSTSTPQMTRNYRAFLRDLPGLLATHAGGWAAYSGDLQIGTGSSKRALYRDCIAAGYRDGEFLICGIEPPQSVELDDLLDV